MQFNLHTLGSRFAAARLMVLLTLCFASQLAMSAPKVQPPLMAMRGFQIAIVEGQVRDINTELGLISVELRQVHAGSMALGIQQIRLNADSAARLHGEINYLFGVVTQVQDPKHTGQAKNAKVAELFVYDGAAPAIWLATEESRALFAPEHAAKEAAAVYPAQLLENITRTSDAQLADLYSAELLSNQPFKANLTAQQSKQLLAMSHRNDLRFQTRARIFLAASNHFLKLSPTEIAQQAQRLMAELPINSDESFDSSTELTLAVLRFFADQKEPPSGLDAALVERFVASDNGAILEQAVRLLLRISPQRLSTQIDKRLKYSLLPRQSRAILLSYRPQANARAVQQ